MEKLDVRNDLNSKELSAVLWACVEKLNNMEDGKARDDFNEIVMKLQSRQCELQEIEKRR